MVGVPPIFHRIIPLYFPQTPNSPCSHPHHLSDPQMGVKMTGNQFVPAGEVTFLISLEEGLTVRMQHASRGFKNARLGIARGWEGKEEEGRDCRT